MCCISPGWAVFAVGRSSRPYSLPSRSVPKKASLRLRWRMGSNCGRERTVASPKRIRPQKAHNAIAQMHASNGSLRWRVGLSAASMWSVTGGRGGRVRLPSCMFASPRSDQWMRFASSSERGGGHPWARCQARTATRYFLATLMETGSKGTSPAKVTSVSVRSATAHRQKEWRSLYDAGRRLASGMEKMSQKRMNLRNPDP